jgi:hypothetical protein
MGLRNALANIKTLHPVSAVLFFAPTAIFLALSVAKDFFCVWELRDPYSVIWWSLGAVAATSALVEINQSSTDQLIGSGDPPMWTRFLSLAFLSLNVNGMIAALGLLPYFLVRAYLGPKC